MVSFDVASAREVLEAHGCGLVVPQGDYAALAEALAALGEAPARRAALGRAGARAARELFDAERMVADYAALYRGAAAARPAAPAPEPAAAAGTARW
jgi:glycosyltransferase involved in cell wall biosynthesis